jgi:hypothetical protein
VASEEGFPAFSDLILWCLGASPPHDWLLVGSRGLADLTSWTSLPNANTLFELRWTAQLIHILSAVLETTKVLGFSQIVFKSQINTYPDHLTNK